MIKTVTISNESGTNLELDLKNYEKSGILVKNITGLGYPTSNIIITNYVGSDIGDFEDANFDSRNITFELAPLTTGGIIANRDKIYDAFVPGSPITVKFVTEDTDSAITETIKTITGYVQSCEATIFTDEETLSVSIICPDPYFAVGEGEQNYSGYGYVKWFSSMKSTTGFTIEIGNFNNIKLMYLKLVYNGGEIILDRTPSNIKSADCYVKADEFNNYEDYFFIKFLIDTSIETYGLYIMKDAYNKEDCTDDVILKGSYPIIDYGENVISIYKAIYFDTSSTVKYYMLSFHDYDNYRLSINYEMGTEPTYLVGEDFDTINNYYTRPVYCMTTDLYCNRYVTNYNIVLYIGWNYGTFEYIGTNYDLIAITGYKNGDDSSGEYEFDSNNNINYIRVGIIMLYDHFADIYNDIDDIIGPSYNSYIFVSYKFAAALSIAGDGTSDNYSPSYQKHILRTPSSNSIPIGMPVIWKSSTTGSNTAEYHNYLYGAWANNSVYNYSKVILYVIDGAYQRANDTNLMYQTIHGGSNGAFKGGYFSQYTDVFPGVTSDGTTFEDGFYIGALIEEIIIDMSYDDLSNYFDDILSANYSSFSSYSGLSDYELDTYLNSTYTKNYGTSAKNPIYFGLLSFTKDDYYFNLNECDYFYAVPCFYKNYYNDNFGTSISDTRSVPFVIPLSKMPNVTIKLNEDYEGDIVVKEEFFAEYYKTYNSDDDPYYGSNNVFVLMDTTVKQDGIQSYVSYDSIENIPITVSALTKSIFL